MIIHVYAVGWFQGEWQHVNLLCFSLFWALVWFGFWRSTWKKVKHHVVLFAKQVFHDVRDKLKEGWWRILHVSTLLSWNCLTMERDIVNYQSDTLQHLEMQSLHVCLQSLECNVIFHKGAVWFQFFPFLLWASGMPKAIPQAIPKRGVQRWRGSAWIFLMSVMVGSGQMLLKGIPTIFCLAYLHRCGFAFARVLPPKVLFLS